MKDNWISINDELPEKGKDIKGKDSLGNTYYAFRCNCHNKDCKEWRESVMGFGLMVDIIKWQYFDKFNV